MEGGAPGYLIAAAMMDRMGRKSIQIIGFTVWQASGRKDREQGADPGPSRIFASVHFAP